jgi:hypothetical protein
MGTLLVLGDILTTQLCRPTLLSDGEEVRKWWKQHNIAVAMYRLEPLGDTRSQ